MFGSIISCTMLPEDLIPCFASELRSCVESGSTERDALEIAKLCDEADAIEDYDSEEAGYVLEGLFDALDGYAPPYGYFGAHPNDGADYGFWLHEDWERIAKEDGALFVGDTSDVPFRHKGEVVHVNDHGNVTLYSSDGFGRLTEVWAVV